MHKGTRSTGGDMPEDLRQKIDNLIGEFLISVFELKKKRNLNNAVVRTQLNCSDIIVLDKENIHIAVQQHLGTPTTFYLYHPNMTFSPQDVLDAAQWEFGFEDPFLLSFPQDLINQEKEQRAPILQAIAENYVESEFQRVVRLTSIIQIKPVFGPASYPIDNKLCFVLMPFDDNLTKIYNDIIKPTIESPKFRLICRRADDYKTNKVIMQDIWKAICEARIIIADLTELNPNVMYELGIAHTVGKETILINQKKGKEIKFPFDIVHFRRIEYEDNAAGGKKLESDLIETLKTILKSNPLNK